MAEYAMPFDFDESAPDPEEYEYSAVEQRMFNMAQRTNGVYPQVRIVQDNIISPSTYVGQSLQVTAAASGLSVIISKGLASIEGVDYINTENKIISFETSAAARTFDIMINLDLVNQKCAAISQVRKSGAAVTDAVIRAVDIYQICIATVTIPARATGLVTSNIQDQRLNTSICPVDGKPLCGLVGAAEQADTRMILDALRVQLADNEDVFRDWFADARQQISDITALAIPVQYRLNDCSASYSGGCFMLSGLPTELPSKFTVRFTAPAPYSTGEHLSIGDIQLALVDYTQSALSANAWKSGALVALDIDYIGAKAYLAASGSTVVNFTLTTAAWTGSAVPYTQTVSVAGVTADSSPGIGFQRNYTPAQFAAYVDSGVAVYSLGSGMITFRAHNSKPTVNIPLFAKVGG